MVLAEETGISKESMSGNGGFYDGWSGMKQLQEGDPALVRREKGHRYSLTTQVNSTLYFLGFLDPLICRLFPNVITLRNSTLSAATRDKWPCCGPCASYSRTSGRVLHMWHPPSLLVEKLYFDL